MRHVVAVLVCTIAAVAVIASAFPALAWFWADHMYRAPESRFLIRHNVTYAMIYSQRFDEGDPLTVTGWELSEAGAGVSEQGFKDYGGITLLRLVGTSGKPATITKRIDMPIGWDPAYYVVEVFFVAVSTDSDGKIFEVSFGDTPASIVVSNGSISMPDGSSAEWYADFGSEETVYLAYDPVTGYFYVGTSVARDAFGDIRKGVFYVGRAGKSDGPTSVTIRVFGEIRIREVYVWCTPAVYWTPLRVVRVSDPYTNVEMAASFDAGLILVTVVTDEGSGSINALDLRGNNLWSKTLPLKKGDEVRKVVTIGRGDTFVVGTINGSVYLVNGNGDVTLLRDYGGSKLVDIAYVPPDRVVVSHEGGVEMLKISGEQVWYSPGYAGHVAVLSDGSVAAASSTRLTIIKGGNRVWTLNGDVNSISASPTKPVFAATMGGHSGSDLQVYLIDSSGEILWKRNLAEVGEEVGGNVRGPGNLAWSPDGQYLAVVGGNLAITLTSEGGVVGTFKFTSQLGELVWASRYAYYVYGPETLEYTFMVGVEGNMIAKPSYSIDSEPLEYDGFIYSVWADPWNGLLLVTAYNSSGVYLVIGRVAEPMLRGFPTAEGVFRVPHEVVLDASNIVAFTDEDLNYCWDLGGDALQCSSSPTVKVRLREEGVFGYSLWVTDSLGGVLYYVSMSFPVKSICYPDAVFEFSPEEPVVGEDVLFNASMSADEDGDIVLYSWDFGDGAVMNTTDPIITHAYTEPGTYTVTLVVYDDFGIPSPKYEEEINVTLGTPHTAQGQEGPGTEETPPESGGGLLPAAVGGVVAGAVAGLVIYLKLLHKPRPPPPPPPPPG